MKIAITTTDNREYYKDYGCTVPYFGTAPEALLQGLAGFPDCEVHVLSCVQQPMTSPAKIAPNIWFHGLHVPKIGWLRTGYQGCMRATRHKLNEIGPDIVHGQGTERDCALSAVFSGFPNILTVHGNMRLIARLNRARPFSFEWLAARLEAFTLPRSEGVVCITRYTQQAVAPVAKRTWLVPNAVDSAFFDIQPRPASPPEIICIGQICLRKNQVRLIESLEPLRKNCEFTLVFYGAGDKADPYVMEFFKRIENCTWARYKGLVGRQALRDALGQASLLVLPSLEDNCPMTVLEAMAAGIPVVAANVGGVPDLVTDQVNGILIDPENLASIRDGVAAAITQPQTAKQLAVAGREKAQTCFHPRRIAARHLEIYREVLSGSA